MRLIIIFAFVVIAWPARADLPLTVEGLITDKGKIKLDLSMAYANADRQGVATGDPVMVQTGPTSFVTLPTLIGESSGNSDTWVASFGLRYGLTEKTELYTRISAVSSSQRNSSPAGFSKISEAGFADAWAGINIQFKQDRMTPALLGFAEIALREKRFHRSTSFKSTLLGLTTYKAIDPVVLSLTGAYRFNQRVQDGEKSYKPGNLLLVNPSVAFAVNDRITLTTGVQWTHYQADRLDGHDITINRTATDLLMGVGYGFAKDNVVNTIFKFNASGRSGAEMRMNWLFNF